MSLSNRIRPNCEAAPWVIEEVKRLEKQREELLDLLKKAEVLFACHCNDATSANWLDDTRTAIASVNANPAEVA